MKVTISISICLVLWQGALAGTRPNIVLILADDLGYADLGCYGGEIRTPHLDQLAAEGIRFTQFYSAARCCPTRAALLTGLYPHQAGLGHMTYDGGEVGYRGDLSQQAVTIAEVLGTAGYQTMMCGKWHVTRHTRPDSSQINWPRQRGFQKFFGTLPGYGSYWNPAGLLRGNTSIQADADFFYTDAISETAVQWLQATANASQPFFLYVSYTAPHYPLHARRQTIESYDGVYDAGWDEIRRRRYQRQIDLGLIKASAKLPLRDEASIPWEDEPAKKWQAHRMQVYAATVEEMDRGIGRILHALDETKTANRTLVVFLSDNGASCEGHRENKIERLDKPWVSSLIPEHTLDGQPVRPGDFPDIFLGPADTFGSYGLRWASVSNAPFRRHKSWVHEGGISVPCIWRWPGNTVDSGTLRHEVAHVIDIMPTLCEVAGANYPVSFRGQPITPLSGVSLSRVVGGESLPARVLCWEHEGNRAVRRGRWKLVSEYPGSWSSFYHYEKQGRWELYDLAGDRTEINDLAERKPDVVGRLSQDYDEWARRCSVIPWNQLDTKQP